MLAFADHVVDTKRDVFPIERFVRVVLQPIAVAELGRDTPASVGQAAQLAKVVDQLVEILSLIGRKLDQQRRAPVGFERLCNLQEFAVNVPAFLSFL